MNIQIEEYPNFTDGKIGSVSVEAVAFIYTPKVTVQ